MTKTIQDWEAFLKPQFVSVNLLGEIPLSQVDYEDFSDAVRSLLKRSQSMADATRRFTEHYPIVFTVFLAHFAAHNTNREFWDALAGWLEIKGIGFHNLKWHTKFLEILEKYHKKTFEDVGGVSNKYVTSMRIHGGIPAYSLGDFFANMVLPSLEKPEYAGLSGPELRDALLKRSTVQFFTDSTVRNFFENSGDFGVAFLEACRRMARSYVSEKQIPEDFNYPIYIAQNFVDYYESREDKKYGLRRPQIKFDPEGDGLLLELPDETLSVVDIYGNQVRWQVMQGKKPLQELRARIIRSGRDVRSEEDTLTIGYLVDPFQVTFSVPNQEGGFNQVREWMFELRPKNTPNLLVFDGNDASLVRWTQSLPAKDLLLVRPKEISFDFVGDARIIHAPDIYAEGWHTWKAEYRSLVDAFSLSLIQDGQTIAVIPIQKQPELPQLIGDPFAPNLDSKPLYVGHIPTLRIPIRPGTSVESELKHWQVEIKSVWEAEPQCRMNFKLSEMSEAVNIGESGLELDLKAVLGNEPIGTYSLRVTGPQNTDVDLPFRVWPSLRIKDLPEFILPMDDEEISLHFIMPVHSSLEIQAGVLGAHVTGEYGRYTVSLADTVTRLDLFLVWPLENASIQVPLSMPVPRIEWRLVLGEESNVKWINRSIQKSVDAFLQSPQTGSLLVQMPGLENQAKMMVLRLIDPDKPKEPLQEFPTQTSVLGSNHARFLLNAKDTINQHKDISVFEFQLLLVNREGLYQPVTPVSLSRKLNVSRVRLEEKEDGLFLLWDEPSPLKNRRVFIRSMWKAWAEPWSIKIPDEVRGKFNLLTTGSLPPSWYEIFFYVAPSWEQDITSPPANSSFIVKMILPDEQIAWLDENIKKRPETSFLNHFERACIYATISQYAKRDQEIQFCYDHIDQAKPSELFEYQKWLENNETSTSRAVRMKMYIPDHLTRLFTQYKPGDEFRNKYLSFVPETSIKPDSAILLIMNENEPALVFHALRELVKRRDNRLIDIIAQMLNDGRLSDADALGILKHDADFFIGQINETNQPNKITLRLLSRLLDEKDELIHLLTPDRIYNLVISESQIEAIKKYLRGLILLEDERGIEMTMELFQDGRLLGEEVTDLLSINPRYSYQVLSANAPAHSYSIQVSELARKFPLETGYIKPGVLVKTPFGWGKITKMVGADGAAYYDLVRRDEKQIVSYYITLEYELEYPLEAIIDVTNQELLIPALTKLYKCGYCDFVSADQAQIVRYHTQHAHRGKSPSFLPVRPRIQLVGDLEFSQTRPEGNTPSPDPSIKTALGKIATDPLSIASAIQRQRKY